MDLREPGRVRIKVGQVGGRVVSERFEFEHLAARASHHLSQAFVKPQRFVESRVGAAGRLKRASVV